MDLVSVAISAIFCDSFEIYIEGSFNILGYWFRFFLDFIKQCETYYFKVTFRWLSILIYMTLHLALGIFYLYYNNLKNNNWENLDYYLCHTVY